MIIILKIIYNIGLKRKNEFIKKQQDSRCRINSLCIEHIYITGRESNVHFYK